MNRDEDFQRRMQTIDAQKQADMAADNDILSARKALESAQARLESYQIQLSQIPINHTRPDPRRTQFYNAIEATKQEIDSAESGVRNAENSFARRQREARWGAQKAEQEKERVAMHEQWTKEKEARTSAKKAGQDDPYLRKLLANRDGF